LMRVVLIALVVAGVLARAEKAAAAHQKKD
jgi:hypothetical protein